MASAIFGLNLYETILAGFPNVLILAICAAVVFSAIILFRIYKALEDIKDMQTEQARRLMNIEVTLANMTGNSNEQD